MLAGVGSIDIALFCVAVDDGVMPQTREHLDILHLLGLRRAVIVITKTDLASPERLAEVRADVEKLLKGTTLEGSPVAEVSTREGQGIDALKALIFSELATVGASVGAGVVRLPIDRVFSVKGFGTVVTGTIVAGTLRVGDELALFQSKVGYRVRGIESHNQKVGSVVRGQRAAVNLTGISHHDLQRGGVLVSPSIAGDSAAVTKLDCVVELSPSVKVTLKDRCRLKLYHFASESNVVFQLGRGGSAERLYGRLHIDSALQVQRGDRFILRDPSIRTTVGGGVVLMPYPSARLTPKLKELDLEELSKGTLEHVVTAMVRKRGYGLETGVLATVLNMGGKEFDAFMYSSTGLIAFKNAVLVRDDLERAREAIIKAIEVHHAQTPGSAGLTVEKISAAVKSSVGSRAVLAILDGLLEAGLIEDMVALGLLKATGVAYSLPLHSAELSDPDKEFVSAVMALFAGKLKSVTTAEIKTFFASDKDLQRILAGILERGEIVKLKDGVFIKAANLTVAKEHLQAHIKASGSIRAAQMRDLLGCGRKLAIEILEYFDKERVTLRKGDERVLR
jgi:selenocysteine-specific elongation factor